MCPEDNDDIFFDPDAEVEVNRCKCGCGETAGATGYASPACAKKDEIDEVKDGLDFLDE